MKTKIAKDTVAEIIKSAVQNITFLSTDEKLEVRNLQLALINAQNHFQESQKKFMDYLNQLVIDKKLNPSECTFDVDNLTFVPRNK